MLTDFRRFLIEAVFYWKIYVLLLTPLVFLPIPLLHHSTEAACGYALIIMAVYWITEALPLPVTALLPMFLFPVLGIMPSKQVAGNYIADSSMVFVGGLLVALAIEKSNLHTRIALKILVLVGSRMSGILFGFMVPTWFLSMWISNTATTAMMIPVAEAVIEHMGARIQHLQQEVGTLNLSFDEQNEETVIDNSHPRPRRRSWDVVIGSEMEENSTPQTNDRLVLSSQKTAAEEKQRHEKFAKMLTLSIAYAANIGGTATMTGSPTNLLVAEVTSSLWESHGLTSPLTYITWLFFGVPHAVLCLILAFAWLQFLHLGWRSCACCGKEHADVSQHHKPSVTDQHCRGVKEIITDSYNKLGSISFAEISVLIFFITLIILWFARDPGFAPGYASHFKKGYITDSMPAILVAILLFIFPSEIPNWRCWRNTQNTAPSRHIPSLLDWQTVSSKFPWGPLLILGSGYALADACQTSGLSLYIGQQLKVLHILSPVAVAFLVTTFVAFFTEFTSNAAVISICIPVLVGLSSDINVNPLYLLLPAGMAASYAFMLPIATPPNTIVFSYGRLHVADMAKCGIMMNVLCILVCTLGLNTWGKAIFNFDSLPWETIPANNWTTASMQEVVTGKFM